MYNMYSVYARTIWCPPPNTLMLASIARKLMKGFSLLCGVEELLDLLDTIAFPNDVWRSGQYEGNTNGADYTGRFKH